MFCFDFFYYFLSGISASPSTPKHGPKYRDNDNIFATPKSHYINDDCDSDSSPYSLSFSQRAPGVEVTWGERTKSTPFKSKPWTEQRETESPPTSKMMSVDVELDSTRVTTESPKGLFKFLLGWERRGISTQIENDFQRIGDDTISALNAENNVIVNSTNSNNTPTNDSSFYPAIEPVGETKSKISNSSNLKQFLNDSEDMDLFLSSQRIEQEICSRTEPVIQPVASKGFADIFADDDGKTLFTFIFQFIDGINITNR